MLYGGYRALRGLIAPDTTGIVLYIWISLDFFDFLLTYFYTSIYVFFSPFL
jgi:hypothetical protein